MKARCVIIWENGECEFSVCEDLYDYQDAVSGMITGVYSPHLPAGTTVYANDEGILLNMEYNSLASLVVGTHLVGPVVVAGPVDDEGEVLSITDEVVEEIMNWGGIIK